MFICVHLWLSLASLQWKGDNGVPETQWRTQVRLPRRSDGGAAAAGVGGDFGASPQWRDGLITALEEIQRHYGYLGQDQLRYAARELSFPLAQVYGVATFYNLFLFDPPGEVVVRVCRGACHVNQADAILQHLCDKLEIGVDETTPDGASRCRRWRAWACSLAPVVVVGDETHGRMTPDGAWAALDDERQVAASPTEEAT
ncbi:MAG: NAD(P)H-dependent oxidoreductase subunit E [Caldilineaceae bacterium]